MTPSIPLILHAVLDEYTLPWDGDHGVAHWARVLENGLRLAEETGANVEVVQLFAVLHQRGHGPGPRAPPNGDQPPGLVTAMAPLVAAMTIRAHASASDPGS